MPLCVISGTEITSLGSKIEMKSMLYEHVDGVSTLIGPVHKDAMSELEKIVKEAEKIAEKVGLATRAGQLRTVSIGTLRKISQALINGQDSASLKNGGYTGNKPVYRPRTRNSTHTIY
ncbi:MAG: hypothetical protein ABII07_01545 [Patescibacteria group bacterium]|nr:hypothetical protein [Patescibacteria group bacterium]